ncbi:hypothetical protein JXA84_06690 [candidate division WOR-3 bacterium]|nr:hypothetical protein [candidate division WOR-3 bacterium]
MDNYSNVGAGAHNLVWQGRDRNGDEVSAGTYFFRLEASGNVFSGKIIVAE